MYRRRGHSCIQSIQCTLVHTTSLCNAPSPNIAGTEAHVYERSPQSVWIVGRALATPWPWALGRIRLQWCAGVQVRQCPTLASAYRCARPGGAACANALHVGQCRQRSHAIDQDRPTSPSAVDGQRPRHQSLSGLCMAHVEAVDAQCRCGPVDDTPIVWWMRARQRQDQVDPAYSISPQRVTHIAPPCPIAFLVCVWCMASLCPGVVCGVLGHVGFVCVCAMPIDRCVLCHGSACLQSPRWVRRPGRAVSGPVWFCLCAWGRVGVGVWSTTSSVARIDWAPGRLLMTQSMRLVHHVPRCVPRCVSYGIARVCVRGPARWMRVQPLVVRLVMQMKWMRSFASGESQVRRRVLSDLVFPSDAGCCGSVVSCIGALVMK